MVTAVWDVQLPTCFQQMVTSFHAQPLFSDYQLAGSMPRRLVTFVYCCPSSVAVLFPANGDHLMLSQCCRPALGRGLFCCLVLSIYCCLSQQCNCAGLQQSVTRFHVQPQLQGREGFWFVRMVTATARQSFGLAQSGHARSFLRLIHKQH